MTVMSPWRRVWTLLGALLILVIIAVLARLFLPISTPPFRDAAGAPVPNSVAMAERWDLNGLEHSVVIRARDSSKPALVWAGDFLCETPPLRHFNYGLEDYFLVVYWCPRYSGQSIDPFAPLPKTLTLAQYAADLGVLVDRVRARFHKDKVILVAHSSGTNYGLIYAAEHPDKLIAYVGVGQMVNAPKNFALQRDFDLEQAKARQDSAALAELEAIGAPPFSDADMVTLRKWAILFGGAFHGDLTYMKLALLGSGTSEANWRDIYAFLWGAPYTDVVAPEQKRIAFDEVYRRFGEPIYFLSGRFDHRADSGLAEAYLSTLDAPHKEFVWFESSAHSPPFEQPEEFNAWIVTHFGRNPRAAPTQSEPSS
jgi:proline iminopeptidase